MSRLTYRDKKRMFLARNWSDRSEGWKNRRWMDGWEKAGKLGRNERERRRKGKPAPFGEHQGAGRSLAVVAGGATGTVKATARRLCMECEAVAMEYWLKTSAEAPLGQSLDVADAAMMERRRRGKEDNTVLLTLKMNH